MELTKRHIVKLKLKNSKKNFNRLNKNLKKRLNKIMRKSIELLLLARNFSLSTKKSLMSLKESKIIDKQILIVAITRINPHLNQNVNRPKYIRFIENLNHRIIPSQKLLRFIIKLNQLLRKE